MKTLLSSFSSFCLSSSSLFFSLPHVCLPSCCSFFFSFFVISFFFVPPSLPLSLLPLLILLIHTFLLIQHRCCRRHRVVVIVCSKNIFKFIIQRKNKNKKRARRTLLKGYTVVETKATLKVVRTRVEHVLIYSLIENATPCSLPRTQVVNFISNFKRDSSL